MALINDNFRYNGVKIVGFLIWVIGVVSFIAHELYVKCTSSDYVFCPYSAKVELYYTEHFKRGGTYYQRIILKDKTSVTANAFSAVVDGRKTWLIDYIAVGDSLAHISWDTIYVYREGSKTYKFVYNIKDF